MSKQRTGQSQAKTSGTTSPITAANKPEGFRIPYAMVILAVVAFILYVPALSFKFTDLDDTIFIVNFKNYNEDIQNLLTSFFQRGLFDVTKDPYYRPLFLDSMILNYQLSGEDIFTYHLFNILLHVCSVVLLYRLLGKLQIKEIPAFVLSLIFAVHPVLAQAVAWIPGRNDTMLAIFIISFLIQSVNYANEGKQSSLLLSALFLLLAFFTKETAVFAAPVALVLIAVVMRKPAGGKTAIAQYVVWAVCFGIWFAVRSAATTADTGIASAEAFKDMIHRLPVILQYFGKVFLPFNLSVFPTQEDTVLYFGLAAVAILAGALYLNKERDMRVVWGGVGIFLLFLMPALLVPARLNEQTFEHRLYLPMTGMLLVLSQTALFRNRLPDKTKFYAGMGLCALLAVLNIRHQQNFADKLTFWTSAVETSPNSAYANMMLAARLDKSEFKRSEQLFRKAYALNPKEKYLNYYIGEMLQKKDSVLASEPYLLAEKNGSGYYETDFLLAHVAIYKRDFTGAINHLNTYLRTDARNPNANNNLLLLYVDTKQADKARQQARRMQQLGLPVPPQILQQLGM